MNHLLEKYINAKYKSNKYCNCVGCDDIMDKISKNNIFCCVSCKDSFWNKIRGRRELVKAGRITIPSIDSSYPGGYSQFKIDLRKAEEEIVEEIIFGESVMRYVVLDSDGDTLGIFIDREDAVTFVDVKVLKETDKIFQTLDIIEINVEDVHEYI